MSTPENLPSAEHQSPACGACFLDTEFDGDDFACYACGLGFDPDTLEAFYLDDEADPCGAACDNYWHGDHLIQRGTSYDCRVCPLPSGHDRSTHYHPCTPRDVADEQKASR